jgi:hypothetical protein
MSDGDGDGDGTTVRNQIAFKPFGVLGFRITLLAMDPQASP